MSEKKDYCIKIKDDGSLEHAGLEGKRVKRHWILMKLEDLGLIPKRYVFWKGLEEGKYGTWEFDVDLDPGDKIALTPTK